MNSSLCSTKNSSSWIVFLISCLACVSFLDSVLLSILITSLGLILSTLLFTFSKLKSEDESIQHVLVSKHHQETEYVNQEKQESQRNIENQTEKYLLVDSQDIYSESESNDQFSTSEDSDWLDSGNACRSPDCSDDGSISDEESLIEIEIPSGHYVSPNEKDLKLKYPMNYSSKSYFERNQLMELLAEINEMNEEDNLIEIDISMGLIKCSRFEIEA